MWFKERVLEREKKEKVRKRTQRKGRGRKEENILRTGTSEDKLWLTQSHTVNFQPSAIVQEVNLT
jgi:hypothetical protein